MEILKYLCFQGLLAEHRRTWAKKCGVRATFDVTSSRFSCMIVVINHLPIFILVHVDLIFKFHGYFYS